MVVVVRGLIAEEGTYSDKHNIYLEHVNTYTTNPLPSIQGLTLEVFVNLLPGPVDVDFHWSSSILNCMAIIFWDCYCDGKNGIDRQCRHTVNVSF